MILRTRAAALAATMLTLALPAAAQQPTPLRLGQTVNGELAEGEPTANERGRVDVYRYEGRAGQRLLVTMSSGAFDSYLSIGRPVLGITDFFKSDDDGGDEMNARMRVTLPASGTYYIVAQAFAPDGMGAYTLSLDTLPTPRPASRQAVTLGRPVNGSLSDTDAQLEDEETYYDLYTFRGRAGQRLVVELRSEDYDAKLEVGRMENGELNVLESNDDGGGDLGTNSRIRMTLEEDGEYVIRATSLNEATGDYVLDVRERPAAPAPRTVTVTRGQTVQGELAETDPELEDGSYYDLYAIRARAGETLTLIMRAEGFDTYLAVGRMVDGEFEVLESADDGDGEGTNSRLEITFEADGEYVIRANSLSAAQTGEYTLLVGAES
jgi:plastocyanin